MSVKARSPEECDRPDGTWLFALDDPFARG
jgi:hypothetical protein